MTNDGAVKCRDKLPDRLRLHIVEMARRNDDILTQGSLAVVSGKDELRYTRSSRDPQEPMSYSAFPIVQRKRDRINLDVTTSNDKTVNLITSEQNVSEEFVNWKTGNLSNRTTGLTNIRRQSADKFHKPFIYDDMKKSLQNSLNRVPVYHVTDHKAVNSIATSMKASNLRPSHYFNSDLVKNNLIERADSFRQKTSIEKCEVKGNACLTPRNDSSLVSQLNQRTGIFSASLSAIKKRRNGHFNTPGRPLFKEALERVEDYVIRVEQKEKQNPPEKLHSPRESKIPVSPRLGQSPKSTHAKKSIQEHLSSPRSTQKRNSPRTDKTLSPLIGQFDSKGYSPSYDNESLSSDEPFRCSYRLPEGNLFNMKLSSSIKHHTRTETPHVADVKTYVLENNQRVPIKPDLAPLTAHNLQVHNSIISNTIKTNNETTQQFSCGSLNIAPNINTSSYQSGYLDPPDNERITTWLNGIVDEIISLNTIPIPKDVSTELLQCLQSCHGAHGSAVAFLSNSNSIIPV